MRSIRTISIPGELKEQMDRYPNENWSAIARESILVRVNQLAQSSHNPTVKDGLKSCPFCGQKARIAQCGGLYIIGCTASFEAFDALNRQSCLVRPWLFAGTGKTKEWAVAKWNERTP